MWGGAGSPADTLHMEVLRRPVLCRRTPSPWRFPRSSSTQRGRIDLMPNSLSTSLPHSLSTSHRRGERWTKEGEARGVALGGKKRGPPADGVV
jgi:hypothetical protein